MPPDHIASPVRAGLVARPAAIAVKLEIRGTVGTVTISPLTTRITGLGITVLVIITVYFATGIIRLGVFFAIPNRSSVIKAIQRSGTDCSRYAGKARFL